MWERLESLALGGHLCSVGRAELAGSREYGAPGSMLGLWGAQVGLPSTCPLLMRAPSFPPG